MQWRTELSALFEQTADGVWVSGPLGRILYWNRAAEAILGYPREQVVGKYCRDIFGGCDSNGNRICGWPCPIKTLLNGGDLVQHFDMSTRTRAGRSIWIDISCIAIGTPADQPLTVVHLFRDVTVAHQIEVLLRQQLAQGLFATSEGNALLNPDLTQREQEVVILLRAGATTAAIADQLFISKATVRNHIQHIFAKLGVHTRLAAVASVNQVSPEGLTPRPVAGTLPRSARRPPGGRVAGGGNTSTPERRRRKP